MKDTIYHFLTSRRFPFHKVQSSRFKAFSSQLSAFSYQLKEKDFYLMPCAFYLLFIICAYVCSSVVNFFPSILMKWQILL